MTGKVPNDVTKKDIRYNFNDTEKQVNRQGKLLFNHGAKLLRLVNNSGGGVVGYFIPLHRIPHFVEG